MDYRELLRELSLVRAPSGFEGAVGDIVHSHLGGLADGVRADRIGNRAWIFGAGKRKVPRLALIAHADEVGFVVERITDGGFLQVLQLGGWNPLAVSAQPVAVYCRGEWVPGVTTALAPHLIKKGGDMPERIYIDIGASCRKEAEESGIGPGSFAVPAGSFIELKNGRVASKAFDDRAGVAMLVAVGKNIAPLKDSLPVELQLGLSVQEEVGTRGARTYYNTFAPDYAVILEGAPADDTPEAADSLQQGTLGKGPQIRTFDMTMIPSRFLVDRLAGAAGAANVPVQMLVRKTGGTDGREIHLSGPGVPSVVFSIPVRGAHSPFSVIDLEDLGNAVRVLMEFIPSFQP